MKKYFGFEIEIGGESGYSIVKSSGINSTRAVDTPRYQEHCLTPNILGDTMRNIDFLHVTFFRYIDIFLFSSFRSGIELIGWLSYMILRGNSFA